MKIDFTSKPALPFFPSGKMQRLLLFEYVLYFIILAIAMAVPFYTGEFSTFGWKRLTIGWLQLLPFVFVFSVNNYIMVPRLLFRDKYLYYILACVLTVIAFVCMSNLLFDAIRQTTAPFEISRNIPMDTMNEPPPGRIENEQWNFPHDRMRKRQHGSQMPPPPFIRPDSPAILPAGRMIPPFFHLGSAIIAFLVIGFNTGVKSFVRWSEEKEEQAEKERQYIYTELAYLKHQISPHFFMNTLNNIHALVDINAEEAKNAIIRLSRLMRYLLYESNEQKVSLRKEVNFIKSYIELMRLRYDEDSLLMETTYPNNEEDVYVPSFLFLSFIENAFKHGVNPNQQSLIQINFLVENNGLTFSVTNSTGETTTLQSETMGIGLENVRKRLDLIYKDNYSLNIRTSEHRYEVTLKIPVT